MLAGEAGPRGMKTIVYIGTSLDGFIAKRDGDIGWLTEFEDAVRNDYEEFIGTIDAVLMGRGSFEKVLTFPAWPYEKKVFVLSTGRPTIPGHLKERVTVLSMKPRDSLKTLSMEGFTNIYVDGGKVIQSFLREDCIDEMIITRVPLLLGNGIPLFGELDRDLRFEHLETKLFPNGLVRSHYIRSGPRGHLLG